MSQPLIWEVLVAPGTTLAVLSCLGIFNLFFLILRNLFEEMQR